jgi:SAM-dependent methyltransferase
MTTEPFGPSLSFSPIAEQYDARYQIPNEQLIACFERLRAHDVLPGHGVLLDAGCGTGQMSLPLAELGYEVRGYDISPEMIAVARSKVRPGLRATYNASDVRSLPESDEAFDGIVVCKLFVHISDWRNAVVELLRVLKPGACLVLLNDAIALENSVRSFFGQRADDAGHSDRFVGLHPARRSELTLFLLESGCTEISVDAGQQTWSRELTYGAILDQFRQRLFAEFWLMPESDYDRVLEETSQWVDTLPQGRDTLDTISAQLYVQVFRKGA